MVDSSTDDTGDLIAKTFPAVRLYRYEERKFAGDARNIGIAVARGNIIAFTDADCRADLNWIEEIARAHESPDLAIGGAIGNDEPTNRVGWASYFCEFSQWMPGMQPRLLDDIAAANMSYKRDVFVRYGNFIQGTYCSDTEFHWRMGRENHRLRWAPTILVAHRSIDRFWSFLRHEYHHGRSFAGVRVRSKKFSHLKRLFYVVISPLIPARLLMKAASAQMKSRIYLRQFLTVLPLTLLGLVFWSFGELSGYLYGMEAK
jgi:glycosyltransferase involved in cell wall biosynthesis